MANFFDICSTFCLNVKRQPPKPITRTPPPTKATFQITKATNRLPTTLLTYQLFSPFSPNRFAMSKCAICSKTYTNFGNNGRPLVEGFVCDTCNPKVIEFRMSLTTDPILTHLENLEEDFLAGDYMKVIADKYLADIHKELADKKVVIAKNICENLRGALAVKTKELDEMIEEMNCAPLIDRIMEDANRDVSNMDAYCKEKIADAEETIRGKDRKIEATEVRGALHFAHNVFEECEDMIQQDYAYTPMGNISVIGCFHMSVELSPTSTADLGLVQGSQQDDYIQAEIRNYQQALEFMFLKRTGGMTCPYVPTSIVVNTSGAGIIEGRKVSMEEWREEFSRRGGE